MNTPMNSIEKQIDIICHNCDSVSEGELLSIKARQKKVREALQKLNINIREDEEPPVIAIMGSGGGLRAMVGLLGVLAELAKEGILDAITYICGTSGSTWCMSSLYDNENWSSCMQEMERQIADRLLEPTNNWEKTWKKLNQTFSKEMFSLTNFWAYVFIHKVLNEINENTLSSHQASCESGKNPYPVYSAVEEGSLHSHNPGAWFEFTPHVAGFPAYKTYVKTEQLGSKFKDGKLVKNHPEWDLCYLQGMWGSALADSVSVKEFIKDKIQGIFPKFTEEGSLNNASLLPPNDNEESLDSEGICVCHGCNKMGTFLSSQDLVKMTDKELEVLLEMLLNDFQKISSCEKVQLVLNMLKCVIQWQWGTTNNFLYEWSSNIPDDVYKKEFLSLIDAGLEINSAYPLMLPPNRKVDLMLSFDYSETEPFSTLKSTDEYCKRNGIPFPEIRIDDAESEAPSHSCYMFEAHGTGAPPVLHFPLFNNQNCADKVQEFRKKYATINISYDELQLKELLTLTKQNVQLNKNLILEKFKQVSKCNS